MTALSAAKSLATSLTITPNEAGRFGLTLNKDGQRRSAFELLSYPDIGWAEVRTIWPQLSAIDPVIADHLEIDAKYDVYAKRQLADVESFRRDEGLVLGDIDYSLVPGLSNEARAKLEATRPWTVGQAGRIDGMTPAALGILAAYLRRESRRMASKAIARRSIP
jgi:tRNA uridine 5-carboxymethylaminomethyl modification enzyme